MWRKGNIVIHDLPPLKGKLGKHFYDHHFFLARYLFSFKVAKAIGSLSPDIADFNSWVFPLSAKAFKVVSTCALMPATSRVNSFYAILINHLDLFLLKYKIRKADHVIYLSRQMQERFRDYEKQMGKESTYVPNGIDTIIFHPKSQVECRLKNNLPPDKKIILYCSRLEHYKRPFDYLKALKNLGDEYFGVIAGNGPLLGDIKRWIEENGMGGKVTVLGPVEKRRLSELYSGSDVVVYPGEVEIQPLVPQEAMACGTPVIVSDTLGNNEIVTDGVNGMTIQVGDVEGIIRGVKLLTTDKLFQEKIVRNGLEYMSSRNWDHTSTITFGVYKSLFSNE